MSAMYRLPEATMTTYRRADGELIAGEYAFVIDTETFEMDDEPTEYVKEVWSLTSSETVWIPEPCAHENIETSGEGIGAERECLDCGATVPVPS